MILKEERTHGIITQIKTKLPDYLGGKEVYIDIDIIGTMSSIWDLNVPTLGCCSGHGRVNPSLIIESVTPEELKLLKDYLVKISNKSWDIFMWKLTKV